MFRKQTDNYVPKLFTRQFENYILKSIALLHLNYPAYIKIFLTTSKGIQITSLFYCMSQSPPLLGSSPSSRIHFFSISTCSMKAKEMGLRNAYISDIPS